MERQVKQRVVGAAVLVVLAVIFIPLFLDTGGIDTVVPEIEAVPPPPADDFDARIVPLPQEDVVRLEREAATPLPPPPMVRSEDVVMLEPSATGGEKDSNAAPADAAEAPPVAAVPGAADALGKLAGPREEIESWTVQLGSFSDQDNARRLIERLREKTWPAYLERRQENGRTVFKVRVGPQISRAEADKVRLDLEQGFSLKGMLVRYR